MFRIKKVFKKKTEAPQPERKIELFKKKFEKRQEKIIGYLERAGFDINIQKLSKIFFNTAVLINLLISGYLIYYFSSVYGITWGTVALSMIVLWIFVFVLLIFALWIIFYIAVDLKIFKRKNDIKNFLPYFFQF